MCHYYVSKYPAMHKNYFFQTMCLSKMLFLIQKVKTKVIAVFCFCLFSLPPARPPPPGKP